MANVVVGSAYASDTIFLIAIKSCFALVLKYEVSALAFPHTSRCLAINYDLISALSALSTRAMANIHLPSVSICYFSNALNTDYLPISAPNAFSTDYDGSQNISTGSLIAQNISRAPQSSSLPLCATNIAALLAQ
ncbi:hypothetical protein EV360DRAFT_87675 [Lentinula raphanica]|nr:hypothetical protein EV360DRAFT_87675 [Lentinula raphanica]